jgi:hypothetical protein
LCREHGVEIDPAAMANFFISMLVLDGWSRPIASSRPEPH